MPTSPLKKNVTKTKIPQLGEIAIEASEIVNRLEQIAETGINGVVGKNANTPSSPTLDAPVFLGLDQKLPEEIVQTVGNLIGYDDENEPINYPILDEISKLVMISHSLVAYCTSLERPIIQKLSTRFTTDTTRWIGQLFGFLDCAGFYHDDALEGLVRCTRLMLHYKYPRYLEDGVLALSATSLPTIYSSVASPLGIVQHLCKQLSLPLACVRPVPVNTHFGSQYTMDISVLQKMLTEDIACGRIPLIVIADVGTTVTGHCDNIIRIKELCQKHDVWLHCKGHSLAALILPQHQRNEHNPPIADSITLSLGNWLGIPGLPMITMYRLWDASIGRSKQVGTSRESTLPLLAGLNVDHQKIRRILALPLWTALQALGKDGVHSRVRDAFLASERLWAALDRYKHLRILSQKPGGESGTMTVSELISKPAVIPLLFESTASCVVFQFTPDPTEETTNNSTTTTTTTTTIQIPTKIPIYYDKLNSWLGQILQMDAPQIPIDICETENMGIVLRYCPLENQHRPTIDDIQTFAQCLEQQLIILRATIQHKETFIKLVEQSPVLRLVELPDWAGLGGVRYVPEGWEQLLTDQAKDELNNLNVALVDSLRSTDSAFSLGEGADGLMCVRFGMLTPQSDVDELLNLVISVGRTVEENSRVLDSMSEIVKRGIETATLDLQKENEERLWQEGILRHVPVVGTFVNWWMPKTKEGGVRGRSLNLTQGVVESTENIYKYHMQLVGNTGNSGVIGGGNGGGGGGVGKNPPNPQIQTPILSVGHSRSNSHTSNQSVGPTKNDVDFKLILSNDPIAATTKSTS